VEAASLFDWRLLRLPQERGPLDAETQDAAIPWRHFGVSKNRSRALNFGEFEVAASVQDVKTKPRRSLRKRARKWPEGKRK
jgi:hypothetical protein